MADGPHCPGHQFGGQGKLTFLLVPELVPYRDGEVADFPILLYPEGYKQADHTVAIEVIGAIIGGMDHTAWSGIQSICQISRP